MLNAGRVLTRAQLEEKLYSWEQDVSSNAVEVHIHHLRKNWAMLLFARCTVWVIRWEKPHESAQPARPSDRRLLTAYGDLLGHRQRQRRLQTRHKINQLFDTQQLLFARHLASLTPAQLTQSTAMPEAKILPHHRGALEDDALAFAIYTRDGRRLVDDGDNGKNFCLNRAGVAFVTANCATMTIRGA